VTLCACALSVLLAAGGQTPKEPDFSGRWVLVAPDAAPSDVPRVLIVHQHLRRTDVRGKPMKPFWYLLTVEGDDLKSGIPSGIYYFFGEGSVGGSVPRRMTADSVRWDEDKLVITSENWIERENGTRESLEQHTEVWSLNARGQLVIFGSDKKGDGESTTRNVTYRKEQAGR
jgi:hypothetical protein